MEGDTFSGSKLLQFVEICLMHRLPDNLDRQIGRRRFDQVIHAFVRKQPSDKNDTAIALDARVGRKLLCIYAAENDVRPTLLLLPKDFAAVLADMQMSVKPTIG